MQKIKRKELIDALEKVKPGLSSKEIVEQTTSYAFMKGRVATFNDEIGISHPVPNLEVQATIPARELHLFLTKTKAKVIKLETRENEFLLRAKKAKVGFSLQNKTSLPIKKLNAKSKKWKELPENFTDALSFTARSYSKDMSAPIDTCLHIRQDAIVESTDRFRITQYRLAKKMPVPNFLLPGDSAKQIVKYSITHIRAEDGDSWVHFKTREGTILSCRIFAQDTFRDTRPFLKIKGRPLTFPKNMVELLERADIFTEKGLPEEEVVTISLEKGKMRIRSENKNAWYTETVSCKYDDTPFSFTINAIFLHDILVELKSSEIAENAIKFVSKNWVHMISLSQHSSKS